MCDNATGDTAAVCPVALSHIANTVQCVTMPLETQQSLSPVALSHIDCHLLIRHFNIFFSSKFITHLFKVQRSSVIPLCLRCGLTSIFVHFTFFLFIFICSSLFYKPCDCC